MSLDPPWLDEIANLHHFTAIIHCHCKYERHIAASDETEAREIALSEIGDKEKDLLYDVVIDELVSLRLDE